MGLHFLTSTFLLEETRNFLITESHFPFSQIVPFLFFIMFERCHHVIPLDPFMWVESCQDNLVALYAPARDYMRALLLET